MLRQKQTIPVVVIAGATGTGKSALAAAMASRCNGIVINADSRQVYADFPVITAQPGNEETSLAPHRLYGFLPTPEKLGAGAYAALAAKEIAATHEAGLLSVLVGGTGLYLQALLNGIAVIPVVDQDISRRWQAECVEQGAPALHAVLAARDPESAARLHPNDSQRITRALEVLEGTGKPLGYWHARPVPPSPYRIFSVIVDVPLDSLTPHLATRIDAMIEGGALDEAQAAYARCSNPVAPGWTGIGCAELFQHITGRVTLAACKAEWGGNTRAYAKRQITWFKRDRIALRVGPGGLEEVLRAWDLFQERVPTDES